MEDRVGREDVRIEPWGIGDLPLLQQTLGDPAMTTHLGGPESPAQLAARHERFLRLADMGTGRMFRIVRVATGEAVGTVGYWERTWQDETIYETGWFVLPRFQGRGIATTATAQAIAAARGEEKCAKLHAFPAVDNAPSNAVCRKLGFVLLGKSSFEYPPGTPMRCNDWCLDLLAP